MRALLTAARIRTSILALLAASLCLAGLAPPAQAARRAPTARTVAEGFVGPLGLAVGADGSVYVAEAFAGALTRVDRHGTRTHLAGDGDEIAGVDARGRGNVAYVESTYEAPQEPGGEPGAIQEAVLATVGARGASSVRASLLDHELAENPDGDVAYSFEGVDDECLATLPPFVPAPYTGILDSHPYAVAITGGGWVVADAAGNDLVTVDRRGRTRTAAVLPRVANVLDAATVAEFGLDECFVDATYWGEPVPTDVEVGPDGAWYVTSLPGGPELPGSASVWRVDPRSGAATMVATGLTSAVDLAVAADGTIYVAELFADRISRIVDGVVTPWAEVPMPGAVEIGPRGVVYATTGALSAGAVVTLAP